MKTLATLALITTALAAPAIDEAVFRKEIDQIVANVKKSAKR